MRADGVRLAWLERLRVRGCGGEVRVKLYVARLATGLGVIALPPGTGVSGFRLSRDAMTGAVSAATIAKPPLTCSPAEQARTLRLADTTLTSAYAPGQPWTERWTFFICDTPRPVDLSFTPAADGGTDWSIKAR